MACGSDDLRHSEGRIRVQIHYHFSIAVLPFTDLPIAHPPLAVQVGPKLISWSPFEQ